METIVTFVATYFIGIWIGHVYLHYRYEPDPATGPTAYLSRETGEPYEAKEYLLDLKLWPFFAVFVFAFAGSKAFQWVFERRNSYQSFLTRTAAYASSILRKVRSML